MSISITVTGTPPMVFNKRIEKAVLDATLALQDMGEITAETMRNHITTNTKRQPASGRLADSIQAHITPLGVGVGKIADLPEYWYVQNYGTKFIKGTKFLPGSKDGTPTTVRGDFGGEKPDSALQGIPGGSGTIMSHPGQFGVTAFKYIEPKNYISKTVSFVKSTWSTFMKSRIV